MSALYQLTNEINFNEDNAAAMPAVQVDKNMSFIRKTYFNAT